MAAYRCGKEYFVYGSDFDDLSDIFEGDLDMNKLLDVSNDCEDDGCQYFVCSKASTSEMIACDDDQCAVVWCHVTKSTNAADAHKKATTYVIAALEKLAEHRMVSSASYPKACGIMS